MMNTQKINRIFRKAQKLIMNSNHNYTLPKHVFDFHSRFVLGICIQTYKILNDESDLNAGLSQKINALLPDHNYRTR